MATAIGWFHLAWHLWSSDVYRTCAVSWTQSQVGDGSFMAVGPHAAVEQSVGPNWTADRLIWTFQAITGDVSVHLRLWRDVTFRLNCAAGYRYSYLLAYTYLTSLSALETRHNRGAYVHLQMLITTHRQGWIRRCTRWDWNLRSSDTTCSSLDIRTWLTQTAWSGD